LATGATPNLLKIDGETYPLVNFQSDGHRFEFLRGPPSNLFGESVDRRKPWMNNRENQTVRDRERKSAEMAKEIDNRIVDDLIRSQIEFVTSVPCKQLAGVIEVLDERDEVMHVPCNKEDEGMGLCAGAYMGGQRPCIVMQNTALGVVTNALATLIQFYQIPLPMLISYRGEVGEKVACQVEMAIHTKAFLKQMNIPTYHFHHCDQISEFPGILEHAQVSKKPVAILTDATFWGTAK
jgi:sulfopyruvate decarboxylase subunit alpha